MGKIGGQLLCCKNDDCEIENTAILKYVLLTKRFSFLNFEINYNSLSFKRRSKSFSAQTSRV